MTMSALPANCPVKPLTVNVGLVAGQKLYHYADHTGARCVLRETTHTREIILSMFGGEEHWLRRHWPSYAVASNGELVVVDWDAVKAATDLMAAAEAEAEAETEAEAEAEAVRRRNRMVSRGSL
jgi:hypothetical protein